MHKLILLDFEGHKLDIPENPCTDTLPCVHDHLKKLVVSPQSYGTIMASINALGGYAKAVTLRDGRPAVVLVHPLPLPL